MTYARNVSLTGEDSFILNAARCEMLEEKQVELTSHF